MNDHDILEQSLPKRECSNIYKYTLIKHSF